MLTRRRRSPHLRRESYRSGGKLLKRGLASPSKRFGGGEVTLVGDQGRLTSREVKDLTGAAMHTVTAITRPRQAEMPRSRKPGRRARRSQKGAVDPNGSATAEP